MRTRCAWRVGKFDGVEIRRVVGAMPERRAVAARGAGKSRVLSVRGAAVGAERERGSGVALDDPLLRKIRLDETRRRRSGDAEPLVEKGMANIPGERRCLSRQATRICQSPTPLAAPRPPDRPMLEKRGEAMKLQGGWPKRQSRPAQIPGRFDEEPDPSRVNWHRFSPERGSPD